MAPGVYSVERLVDRRWEKNRWQYLVHWAGFSAEHDTWEESRNILDKQLIDELEQKQHRVPLCS